MQAMHFMLLGKDGLPPLPQCKDHAPAFDAKVDAIKVRLGVKY